MTFLKMLEAKQIENDSLVCVGLDTDVDKLPAGIKKNNTGVFEFNKAIIEATKDLVCCYKPNIAFYECARAEKQLMQTIAYAHECGLPVIIDAKRSDIGNTAKKYAKSIFEYYNADAVTVNPYMGFDSIEPFLEYKSKGIIIVVRSSNDGAKDFQDLLVVSKKSKACKVVESEPLYIVVLKKAIKWNTYNNILAVAGATYYEELFEMRAIAPAMTFLVPGIGIQGGSLKDVVSIGLTANGLGLIINSSRGIIYASAGKDFACLAREKCFSLREEINCYRVPDPIAHTYH